MPPPTFSGQPPADLALRGPLGHQPALWAAFTRLYATLWSRGVLDHPTKEVARLRNARVTGCGYCRNVRFEQARRDGLSEDLVEQIEDGFEDSALLERFKLVIRYTDAFLVDPGGRLVATYRGRLDPERLRQDLALCESSPEKALSPEARRDACVPFAGRWIAPPPGPFDEEVAARLAAHGLERPAAEYRLARVEVRAPSKARLEYEQGVTQHRAGRLVEAIAHYRRALEIDPGYATAAQDLAVALHQHGDQEAALVAYRQALKLDPRHAFTRCNLAYLFLARGDVASAKGELEALRTLKSALAATLEERIREFEKP